MFVFLAALQREVLGLLPLVRQRATVPLEGHWAVRGHIGREDIALVCSGMGRSQTESAAAALMRSLRPRAVMIIGYAGATTPEALPGDLVLANALLTAAPERETRVPAVFPAEVDSMSCLARVMSRGALPPELAPDGALFLIARNTLHLLALRSHVGRLASATTAASQSRKRLLAKKHDTKAVDMESYWAASVLTQEGIPFVAIRAITDGVEDSVPGFGSILTPRGSVSIDRAAAHFFRHPGDIPPAFRLGRASALASSNLATFAGAFAPVATAATEAPHG